MSATSKATAKKITPLKHGFSDALITWYKQNKRDLPWRHTSDPYALWLSEIMLQQTQVNTVIDYYHRFLNTFPTITDLAKADEDKVLKLWEGLGYYSRCRNLHKSAKIIVDQHNGVFPNTFDDVLALPGIGRSTAGAILTFAFAQRQPILDGNVKRDWARLFNYHEDIATKPAETQFWAWSQQFIDECSDPYAFNQGIMELGATICLPKQPRCLVCPVNSFCDSFKAKTQHDLPVKKKKVPVPHYDIAVGVIWNKKKETVFIQKRPDEGLLGGLWEFPGGKQEKNEALEDTVAREIKEELGITVRVDEKIMHVKHAYSHFKITLHAYHCQYIKGKAVPKAATAIKWVALNDLSTFAFPKANKKVLDMLLDAKN